MFERARCSITPSFVGYDLQFLLTRIDEIFYILRLTAFDNTAEVAGTLSSSVEREELIQPMVAIEILCNPIPELPYLMMPKSHIQPPP